MEYNCLCDFSSEIISRKRNRYVSSLSLISAHSRVQRHDRLNVSSSATVEEGVSFIIIIASLFVISKGRGLGRGGLTGTEKSAKESALMEKLFPFQPTNHRKNMAAWEGRKRAVGEKGRREEGRGRGGVDLSK